MNAQPSIDPTVSPSLPEFLGLLSQSLREAARTRLRQLENLPRPADEPLVDVQRETLRQTLTEIHAAQQRVEAGTYGVCTKCHRPISWERLEFRPWSATCVGCAPAGR